MSKREQKKNEENVEAEENKHAKLEGHEKWKIFPRNLTARADRLVLGNPASSRPETGVDNCYPGLEFDQRNLDKSFFPGLVFEFQRDDGAVLHRILPSTKSADQWLRDDDLPLYLWGLIGKFGSDVKAAADPLLFPDDEYYGFMVWSHIHDLLPGPIAILLGTTPAAGERYDLLKNELENALTNALTTKQSVVNRDKQNKIVTAVLAGERARYLDENGVIDIEVYKPGELTRSLCAPWQYDFRDCGCFYWAANKPDLVTSEDGKHPYLNFLRKDRTSKPPPQDTVPQDITEYQGMTRYQEIRERRYDRRRRSEEFGYADLMSKWNDLPVTVNDRETEE